MPQVWYTSGCKCKGKHGQNQCTCGTVALGVAEVVPGCDDKAMRALKGWLMSGGIPGVRKDNAQIVVTTGLAH
eukprot:394367-Prymnesium_polylepis.1